MTLPNKYRGGRLKGPGYQVAVRASKTPSPGERQEHQKALAEIRSTPLPQNPWVA